MDKVFRISGNLDLNLCQSETGSPSPGPPLATRHIVALADISHEVEIQSMSL